MRNLDSKMVVSMWADMGSKFRFTVIDKRSNPKMRMVGTLLQIMRVQDRKEFMAKYATTFRDKIYIPYTIGEGGDWNLVSQVCNLVHEASHVVQYRRDPIRFPVRYLVSSTDRAFYETEVMRASMEMYRYLTGSVLDPALVAGRLKAYGCKQRDIDVTQKSLESVCKVIEMGGITTETAQYAMMLMGREDVKFRRTPVMHKWVDKGLFL